MSESETTDLRSRSYSTLMQIPHYHSYSGNRNSTFNWMLPDSQELFKKNLSDPKTRQQLQSMGWIDRKITYQFNSLGFRCAEFDSTPGIIALGCSFTFGVGLPEDMVWPSVVAKELNLSLWNLAIGGASLDTCFRLLNYYIDKLNAEYVLLLKPPKNRFEWFFNDEARCFMPKLEHPVQRMWLESDFNIEINYIKNLLAIEGLCKKHNRKLIVRDCDQDCSASPEDTVRLARDLMHVGPDAQARCAWSFLNQIKTDQASL